MRFRMADPGGLPIKIQMESDPKTPLLPLYKLHNHSGNKFKDWTLEP